MGRPGSALGWCWRRRRRNRSDRHNRRASVRRRGTCGRISAAHAGDGVAGIPRVALDVGVVRGPALGGRLVGALVVGVGALVANIGLGRARRRRRLERDALAAVVGKVVLGIGLLVVLRVGGHGGSSARGELEHPTERRADSWLLVGRQNV
jgi:hypothetical protein